MKVKIGDTIYDAEDQPIMIILSEGEQTQITNMAPGCTKYCQYNEDIDPKYIEKWMEQDT